MSNGKCQLSNVKWQLVYNYKNESNLRSCSLSDVCNICQVECTGQTGQSEEGGEKKKIAETRHAFGQWLPEDSSHRSAEDSSHRSAEDAFGWCQLKMLLVDDEPG